MKVKICDHKTAALMNPKILGFGATALIRITAQPTFRPLMFPNEFVGVHLMQYGDVTDARWAEWNASDEGRTQIAKSLAEGFYPVPITLEQAQGVLKFMEEMYDRIQTMVVHCDAGISRSSATALAFCDRYGLVEERRRIEQDRWYRPNLTVRGRICELFSPMSDQQKMYEDLFGGKT